MSEKIKVSIIGLGEIGSNLLKAFHSADKMEILDLKCVDVDDNKCKRLRKEYRAYSFGFDIPADSEFYFISVWTTEQVMIVLKQIHKVRTRADSVIVIESTLMPGTVKKIRKLYPNLPFVVFPHRYNGQDPEHHIFNLDRVMGGSSVEATTKVLDFLTGAGFMKGSSIHATSAEIAELCKPMENAYRYAEIALAEQMRLMVEKAGYNWDALRAAMNTKWNINVLEARDGIGKHCLPKDIKIVNDFFPNDLFEACVKLDNKYVKKYGKKSS